MAAEAHHTPLRFHVRLTPKGGRDAIDGWADGADGKRYLKARVAAPPEDGKANEALIRLLAKSLGVAKTKLRIVSGASARVKLIEVNADAALPAERVATLGTSR